MERSALSHKPETTSTHINVSGGGMLKTPAQGKRRSSSSNTWLPTTPSATSPTATTNGLVVASVKVANPALDALGAFKADKLPVNSLAMYAVKAQVIFDKVGYR